MTALAADRNTASRQADIKSYPVAVDIIYKGSLVCVNASGYLVPASDTSGLTGVVGVAAEKVDNSGGSAGDKHCAVESGRQYKFAATSITQAMVGDIMYVEDDQTVDDIGGTHTNEIPAGVLVEYVGTTEGWIFIPQGGFDVGLQLKAIHTLPTADVASPAIWNDGGVLKVGTVV